MRTGSRSHALFAFFTLDGEKRDFFFSAMALQCFCVQHGYELQQAGAHKEHNNAMFYVLDTNTRKRVGYFGKAWA